MGTIIEFLWSSGMIIGPEAWDELGRNFAINLGSEAEEFAGEFGTHSWARVHMVV